MHDPSSGTSSHVHTQAVRHQGVLVHHSLLAVWHLDTSICLFAHVLDWVQQENESPAAGVCFLTFNNVAFECCTEYSTVYAYFSIFHFRYRKFSSLHLHWWTPFPIPVCSVLSLSFDFLCSSSRLLCNSSSSLLCLFLSSTVYSSILQSLCLFLLFPPSSPSSLCLTRETFGREGRGGSL